MELLVASVTLLIWTVLNENAAGLNQVFVKTGFIFLLIGYGTKAGLAPMHTWLPDAHSQAPSPVSALFSGFMLSAALYCITRFIPIAEKATAFSGWAPALLNGFGLLSLLTAAVIVFIAVLKKMIDMGWGQNKEAVKYKEKNILAYLLVFILLGLLFLLGIHIPSPLYAFMDKAARIVSGGG